MNFTIIESKIMNGEKIYNIPLKVCFYARVSTESDVQLNSLDNQLSYYENFIKSKQCWTYVEGYVDEGVSGVRVAKRDGFKKMIRDAKLHKFDLIVTKEVSRFARDLEDSDSNSELILNIMFNLAQEESKKLSNRVKFGHKEAIKRGHVLGSSNIIGYKKENCKLIIIEAEAKLIRMIFELYATGNYGFYKLSKYLGILGYYNKNGNYYDKDTLKRIISNPKYKGYYRGHTYETIDYRTKKRNKIKINEQIIYKCTDGSIPKIVSEELWDKANQILNNRTKSYMNNNYFTGGLKYPLSSKIYCKEHNVTFQRSHGNKSKNRPTWSCGNYLKYKVDGCASPIIAEKDLLMILKIIFNKLIVEKDKIINEMIELYKNIINTNGYDKELDNIEKSIKEIELKKDKTLELVYKNIISEEDVKNHFSRYKIELDKLYTSKDNALKKQEFLKNEICVTNKLSILITEELNDKSLDDFIRKFVTEIIVSKVDNNRIKGAKHLCNADENDSSCILNQECFSIESLRKNKQLNKFAYNVYIESF